MIIFRRIQLSIRTSESSLLKFHFFVTLLYYRIFIDTIIDIQIGRVIDLQRPNLPATCVNTWSISFEVPFTLFVLVHAQTYKF